MATLPLNEFRNFIDNQWCEGVRTFDNRNPVDNSLIGKVHEAGQA